MAYSKGLLGIGVVEFPEVRRVWRFVGEWREGRGLFLLGVVVIVRVVYYIGEIRGEKTKGEREGKKGSGDAGEGTTYQNLQSHQYAQ